LRKDAFKGNLALKLITLLLAILMWARVSGRFVEEQTGVTRVFGPVFLNQQNVPDSTRLSMENYILWVTLEGPEKEINALSPTDLQVVLDLKEYAPGAYNAYLSPEFVRLPPEQPNVTVKNIYPDTVKFTLAAQTVKRVKLQAYTTGQPEENFYVDDVVLMPEEAEIVGPTKNLEGIDNIFAEEIDVTGAKENIQGVLRFDFDRAMPPNTAFTRSATEFRYMVVVKEHEKTISPEREYDIAWEGGDGSAITPTQARLRITGPISVVDWLNPDWVAPFAEFPTVADGVEPPGDPAAQNPPSEATVEPPPAPTASLSARWTLPDDAKTAFPDWRARIGKLVLTWTPERVEVVQQ